MYFITYIQSGIRSWKQPVLSYEYTVPCRQLLLSVIAMTQFVLTTHTRKGTERLSTPFTPETNSVNVNAGLFTLILFASVLQCDFLEQYRKDESKRDVLLVIGSILIFLTVSGQYDRLIRCK